MARIAIDLARRLGTVDPRIFGQFIEHLGRCIYGGVYEEGSPLSDARGFRCDVLDAARPLRSPILRWPGGNFVSGYHWLDGVGPKDRRPRRRDLAWYAEDSNRFGTGEFIEYCRVLGSEPFISVNMGSGTMDEAQAWWSTATAPATPRGPTCVASTATPSPTVCATGGSATRCTAAGRSAT